MDNIKVFINGEPIVNVTCILGKESENHITKLRLQLPDTLGSSVELGDLTYRILFRLPDKTVFPTAELDLQSGPPTYVEYTVEEGCLQVPGHGAMALRGLGGEGEIIWESNTVITFVEPKVSGKTAPEAVPDWITELQAAKDGADQAAAAADAIAADLIQRRDAGVFNGTDGHDGAPGRDGIDGKDGAPGAPGAASTVPGPKGDPGDPATNLVQSVAGKTGVVTLGKADVGLGNIDNTSDAGKPISTAQAAVNTSVASQLADIANSNMMRLVKRITLGVNTASVTIDQDEAGQAFRLKACQIVADFPTGIGDKTSGLASALVRLCGISASASYLTAGGAATSFGVGCGNLYCHLKMTLWAMNSRITGILARGSIYGAALPGTASGITTEVETVSDAAFNTVTSVTITGSGGSTESTMHAGGVIELWGIDA